MVKPITPEYTLTELVKDYCTDTHDTLQAALEDFRGDSYAPYYSQINELYDQYECELWELLEEYCDDIGEAPLAFLDSCSKRYTSGQHITNLQGVKQWLVWFGLEHIAYKLACELEDE